MCQPVELDDVFSVAGELRLEARTEMRLPVRFPHEQYRLDLDLYPYLPKANVAKTSAASYLCLTSGDAR